MSKKFLDYEGLLYFWNKIKGKFSTASNWLDGSQTGSVRMSGSKSEDSNYTIGQYATTEGYNTQSSGKYSHAEGKDTIASGIGSHAEGRYTTASENCSHAEGFETIASERYSHAGGFKTVANHYAQTAIGVFNVLDTTPATPIFQGGVEYGNYAFIIGNGSSDNERSNALTVDWNGNVNIPSGASYKVDGVPIGGSDSIFPIILYTTSYADMVEALENGKILAEVTEGTEEATVKLYNAYWSGSEITLYGFSLGGLDSSNRKWVEFPILTIDENDNWNDISNLLIFDYTTYTAGNGINITNGVISIDLPYAEEGGF